MKVDTILMDMPTNVQNATIVKELVLNTLLKNKVITITQHKEYMDEWQIIIIKRSCIIVCGIGSLKKLKMDIHIIL